MNVNFRKSVQLFVGLWMLRAFCQCEIMRPQMLMQATDKCLIIDFASVFINLFFFDYLKVGARLPTLKTARTSPPRATSIFFRLVLVYMAARNCLEHSQMISQKYVFWNFLKIRDFNSNLEKSLSVHKWPFSPTKQPLNKDAFRKLHTIISNMFVCSGIRFY